MTEPEANEARARILDMVTDALNELSDEQVPVIEMLAQLVLPSAAPPPPPPPAPRRAPKTRRKPAPASRKKRR